MFSRFVRPLEKYRRFIADDPEPVHEDEEMIVAGINTARSLTHKYGRINERQVARLQGRMCHLREETFKIIVTHHPFDLPAGENEREIVGRARMAMEAFAACGADLLLAGHLHIGHTGHTAERYKISGHSALVVQAGTATSSRVRGESNSFNVIRLKHPHIQVERRVWQSDAATFRPGPAETFRHTSDGWVRVSDEVAAGVTFDEEGTGLQPHIPAETTGS